MTAVISLLYKRQAWAMVVAVFAAIVVCVGVVRCVRSVPEAAFAQLFVTGYTTTPAIRTMEAGYSAAITVQQPGPVTVTLQGRTGYAHGPFSTGPDEVVWRAFFLLDPPVGARLSIDYARVERPSELRLHLDREGDGHPDEVLAPTAAATGKDLEQEVGLVEATVSDQSGTDAVVTIVPDVSRSSGRVPDADGVYYAVYPDEPWLHAYTQPVRVPLGNVVVYSAWTPSGYHSPLDRVPVGSPRAPDIRRTLPTTGEPVTISSTTPGQQIWLTFDARAGQHLSLTMTGLMGGSTSADVAQAHIHYSDGSTFLGRYYLPRSENQLKPSINVDRDLSRTDRYTLWIDPQLAHVITCTITLTLTPTSASAGPPPVRDGL